LRLDRSLPFVIVGDVAQHHCCWLTVSPHTGNQGETVTDVSQRLLAQHGGLRGLFRLDIVELSRIRGLSVAKAVRLQAAQELGRPDAALSPEERRVRGVLTAERSGVL
jgi:DNA repair protein RadC